MSQFLSLQFSPSFTFASVVFFNLLNILCFFSPRACYNACLSFLVFKWNRLFFLFIWMYLMLLCRSKTLHNCWHVPTFNPPAIKYRLRPASLSLNLHKNMILALFMLRYQRNVTKQWFDVNDPEFVPSFTCIFVICQKSL